MGSKAKGLEVCFDVDGSGERGSSAGNVGLQSKVAEVRGDGVVSSGGDECVPVVKGVL